MMCVPGMTELVNNNAPTNLVDKSNNSLPSKEQQEDQNRITNGESKGEEEEEHTIKIPFFSLEKYKKGLITTFDEIIGLF